VCKIRHVFETEAFTRPRTLGFFLIFGGVIGLIASFVLSIEKIAKLRNPNDATACDFSLVVQCSANLDSWAGSLFGFPNSFLGLAGFVVPIVIGAGILAGAQFGRWFWLLFATGIAGAFIFVIWLSVQSIFVIGTLCPWCLVVWSVTIPLFWAVIFFVMKSGILPVFPGLQRFASGASAWVPAITVFCYIVIALMAQIQLDVLAYL